ncbi:MAG TPA: response regulator [Baekduia sp.]|uniref:adenylate/guanylate cyclase domain-containing protein n=1 Tax=Baekduia sp. TaxID=2600305 RepID=UPI002D767B43|nr:response regulator [Baekduia sp.]HET6507506.1 response regulator [Baekduia sp.]
MRADGSADSILVVDDDPVNRALLRRSLEAQGHIVRTAEDGARALELLVEETGDLVLLDIVMPELDGVAVLERVKADPLRRHVPVIMISAVDEIDSVVRCIELGAEDYLPKPFDPVLLRARINAGLSRKRLHDLERDRVRDVFARFVPEGIVDQVVTLTGDGLRLGGTLVEGTILFNDIRDFTAYAERHPPSAALEVLNRFLGRMSDVVLDHGGSHLGFRGDGMMAAFGAPITMADHADRALDAARSMLDELPRFNAWMREQGLGTGFRIGIGICSGPFMAGNVGSERRLEYTAIGDTPNTAARLEAMTKGTPHSVLLADSTRRALVQPPSDLVAFGEHAVRGRREPVRLWSIESA